jgi:hypothetical protein
MSVNYKEKEQARCTDPKSLLKIDANKLHKTFKRAALTELGVLTLNFKLSCQAVFFVNMSPLYF